VCRGTPEKSAPTPRESQVSGDSLVGLRRSQNAVRWKCHWMGQEGKDEVDDMDEDRRRLRAVRLMIQAWGLVLSRREVKAQALEQI